MSGRVEIVTAGNGARWREWLERAGQGDVYYRPEYLEVFTAYSSGEALMFAFESADGCYLHIFRRRRISMVPGLENFAERYDISTEYGIGGPVLKTSENGNRARLATDADIAFREFCRHSGIIAEFVRFHPLLENADLMPDTEKRLCNETVYVDLTPDEDRIFAAIRTDHRYQIRRSAKSGITVERKRDLESLEAFHSIYLQTMSSVGASAFYLFPLSLFISTMELLGDRCELFIAYRESRPISGSFFLRGEQFAHYHLSGTSRDELRSAPNKLIIWEAIRYFRAQGLTKLHLGGGHGNREHDPLMLFKAGFSPSRAEFFIGRRIHDQNSYLTACAQRGINPTGGQFFPAYRQ